MKALAIFLSLMVGGVVAHANCSGFTLAEYQNDVLDINEFSCFLEQYNSVTTDKNDPTMESVIAQFPFHFKRNITLKSGIQVSDIGPNGHPIEKDISTSATKEHPRVFLWDETTGFTASWNGHPGDDRKKDNGFHRMDLYSFDMTTKKHNLMTWDPINGRQIVNGSHSSVPIEAKCIRCHGPNLRPTFPMYPDWPGFFGSFNDELAGYPNAKGKVITSDDSNVIEKITVPNAELANTIQLTEQKWLKDFRASIAGSPMEYMRYAPLFEQSFLDEWTKIWPETDHALYPYRPDNGTAFSLVSRSFLNRPNLRIGVLYGRLVALEVFERIKKSSTFPKFKEEFLYSVMDCNWQKFKTVRATALASLKTAAAGMKINGVPVKLDFNGLNNTFGDGSSAPYGLDKTYRQIPYETLLAAYGIEVRDIDFRLNYNNKLYNTESLYSTQSIMDIGYMKTSYKAGKYLNSKGGDMTFPYNPDSPNMKYFNSYFDGSATSNELLAAQTLMILAKEKPDVFGKYLGYLQTLKGKYRGAGERYLRDRVFFDKVDKMSPWLPTPYPLGVLDLHHREGFYGSKDNSPQTQYNILCNAVGSEIEKKYKK
jgi:hypothetical protein